MTHCEFHIFQTLSRATSIKLLPLAHRAAKISPTAQNRDNILHSRRKKLYVKCVYVFDGGRGLGKGHREGKHTVQTLCNCGS